MIHCYFCCLRKQRDEMNATDLRPNKAAQRSSSQHWAGPTLTVNPAVISASQRWNQTWAALFWGADRTRSFNIRSSCVWRLRCADLGLIRMSEHNSMQLSSIKALKLQLKTEPSNCVTAARSCCLFAVNAKYNTKIISSELCSDSWVSVASVGRVSAQILVKD